MATTVKIDWALEIERLEREAEAVALAKADEVFAELAAEHERQTQGYHFECRRWGDFLSVFVEREANQESYAGSGTERKVSTSLNIGQTKEIKLIHGRCFDRRGTITYYVSTVSDAGSGWSSGGSGSGPPPKGCHYEVEPSYPYVPKSRKMVALDPKPQEQFPGMTMGYDEPRQRLITKDYPRAAEDDVIRFNGIGAAIHAPAGKGQEVYDAILAEIERGYEPPKVAV